MTFGTLFGRILLVATLLLGGFLLAMSRRRRPDPAGMLPALYLVVGLLFFASLPDAVPLPRAAVVAAFAIQTVFVFALFWKAFRMANRS